MFNYKLKRLSIVDTAVFIAFLYLAGGFYGLVYSLVYTDSLFEVPYVYLLLVTPFQGFIVGSLFALFFNVYGHLTGGFRCEINSYQPTDTAPKTSD